LILDGDPHGEYHRIQKDENRDKYIKSLRFTVIRFENRHVFQDPEYIRIEIRRIFNVEDNQYYNTINHPGR
jgi:very-short-patch-repair endonuclease